MMARVVAGAKLMHHNPNPNSNPNPNPNLNPNPTTSTASILSLPRYLAPLLVATVLHCCAVLLYRAALQIGLDICG
jgi:hypothetical protein